MNAMLEPFVRYIAKSTYIIADKFIIAKDCRLIYIISGNGALESNGQIYPLSPGTLLYYPCGTPYQFSLDKENRMLFYTVNFDFSQAYTDVLPMAPEDYHGHPPSNMLYTQTQIQCDAFQNTIYLPGSIWCENLLGAVCDEGLIKNEGYAEVQSALLRTVLINIYRHLQGPRNHFLCKQVEEIVSCNLQLNNKQIAEALNYHPFYLNSVMKREKGLTLHQYVLGQRLAKAHSLIVSTQLSMEEIASLCGFSSQSHLSSAFKKRFGVAPIQIRKFL